MELGYLGGYCFNLIVSPWASLPAPTASKRNRFTRSLPHDSLVAMSIPTDSSKHGVRMIVGELIEPKPCIFNVLEEKEINYINLDESCATSHVKKIVTEPPVVTGCLVDTVKTRFF